VRHIAKAYLCRQRCTTPIRQGTPSRQTRQDKSKNMTNLIETEYWVYRKGDQSLVGNLFVSDLQDDFMETSFSVCSGRLIYAESEELERLFRGEYVLKHPGKEESFGDFQSVEEVCQAVRDHPEGPYFLTTVPVLPHVD
jgi:hypothetical protein